MSITGLSSSALYKKYVHIYTVQNISNHINTTSSTSTHPFNSQTVQKRCFTNQERSVLQKDVFRFFFKEERDGELRTFVGREFQILAA